MLPALFLGRFRGDLFGKFIFDGFCRLLFCGSGGSRNLLKGEDAGGRQNQNEGAAEHRINRVDDRDPVHFLIGNHHDREDDHQDAHPDVADPEAAAVFFEILTSEYPAEHDENGERRAEQPGDEQENVVENVTGGRVFEILERPHSVQHAGDQTVENGPEKQRERDLREGVLSLDQTVKPGGENRALEEVLDEMNDYVDRSCVIVNVQNKRTEKQKHEETAKAEVNDLFPIFEFVQNGVH